MKKMFVYGILYSLIIVYVLLIFLVGIDIETARQDYLKAKEKGNYEQKIEGCIFEFVCKRYTKELQK